MYKKLSKYIHRFSLFLFVYLLWLAFSGLFSAFFIIAGAICSGLAVWIAHRMDVVDHEGYPFHMTRRPLLYWLWLAKEMLKSSLEVSWIIWQPRMNISPTLAWIPDEQETDLGRVTYANSITLTPGTVCIELKDGQLLVHALRKHSIESLQSGEMSRRVRDMIVDLELTDLQKKPENL
jgi:multicomponent Na+:H+ antiporter subunit E